MVESTYFDIGVRMASTFIVLSAEGYFYTQNKKKYLGDVLVDFWRDFSSGLSDGPV